MNNEPLCKICGKPESDHHDFEGIHQPKGCVCDVKTYDGLPIPSICSEYVKHDDDDDRCKVCEHDFECHSTSEAVKP